MLFRQPSPKVLPVFLTCSGDIAVNLVLCFDSESKVRTFLPIVDLLGPTLHQSKLAQSLVQDQAFRFFYPCVEHINILQGFLQPRGVAVEHHSALLFLYSIQAIHIFSPIVGQLVP